MSAPRNDNASGQAGGGAKQITQRVQNSAASFASQVCRIVWRMSYATEEARQRYAQRQQRCRHFAACVLLALLRIAGGRHA